MEHNLREVTEWPLPKALIESAAVRNRNLFAEKFASVDPDKMLSQWVFLDKKGLNEIYGQIFDLLPRDALKGEGLELGAGVCALSAVALTRFTGIQRIHAVELVPNVVSMLQPSALNWLCKTEARKIERIIGSFDDLDLPDQSIDFCIEVASLHHSDNLEVTLKETARVLKPNAPLVMIDRVHEDSLSEEQRKFMLNVEYSSEWKQINGYESTPLNRRENGEHEYRISEWKSALNSSGFVIEERHELRPVSWRRLLRGLKLCLPFPLRRALKWEPSRAAYHRGEIFWQLRTLLGIPPKKSHFHRALLEYSILIARRQ